MSTIEGFHCIDTRKLLGWVWSGRGLPEPPVALLVVQAGAEFRKGFPLLDGRVSVTVGPRGRGGGRALSDCRGRER